MVAGGLFTADGLGGHDPDHASKVLAFGQAMLRSVEARRGADGRPIHIRVGVHSGPVTSGVIGQRQPHFCLFG